jgi:hypothetical protein
MSRRRRKPLLHPGNLHNELQTGIMKTPRLAYLGFLGFVAGHEGFFGFFGFLGFARLPKRHPWSAPHRDRRLSPFIGSSGALILDVLAAVHGLLQQELDLCIHAAHVLLRPGLDLLPESGIDAQEK